MAHRVGGELHSAHPGLPKKPVHTCVPACVTSCRHLCREGRPHSHHPSRRESLMRGSEACRDRLSPLSLRQRALPRSLSRVCREETLASQTPAGTNEVPARTRGSCMRKGARQRALGQGLLGGGWQGARKEEDWPGHPRVASTRQSTGPRPSPDPGCLRRPRPRL